MKRKENKNRWTWPNATSQKNQITSLVDSMIFFNYVSLQNVESLQIPFSLCVECYVFWGKHNAVIPILHGFQCRLFFLRDWQELELKLTITYISGEKILFYYNWVHPMQGSKETNTQGVIEFGRIRSRDITKEQE